MMKLILVPLIFLSFLSLQAQAQQYTGSIGDNRLAYPSGYDPLSLKLITVSCDSKCDGKNGIDWSKGAVSGGSKYTDFGCTNNTFEANNMSKVLGITDYNDGVSINNLKTYPNFLEIQRTYAQNKRYCEYQNQLVGNIGFSCYPVNTGIMTKSEQDEYDKTPRLAVCTNPFEKINAKKDTPKGSKNPIYTYQFNYKIDFTEDQKESKSELYRKMTGLDGVYDSVVMTWTTYTFQENGVWRKWENPIQKNIYGGWLVYGQKEL